MTTDPQPDAGIDVTILDRMTDTLIILQVKSASIDRGKMIATLQDIRRQHPGAAQVLLVEGETEARVVREYLLALERTSLGAPDARRTRARATATRVANILIRHQDGPGQARAPGPAQASEAEDQPVSAQAPRPLTARERQVAALLALGTSDREIASRLFISRRTVDARAGRIFSELGISSRAQLAAWLQDEQAHQDLALEANAADGRATGN